MARRLSLRRSPVPLDDPSFDLAPPLFAEMPAAAAEWTRLAPILRRRRQVTEADRGALMALCVEWDRYIEAREHATPRIIKAPDGKAVPNPWLSIQTTALGECLKLWAELGLTPSSRVSVPGTDDGDLEPLDAAAVQDVAAAVVPPVADDADVIAERRRRVCSLRLLHKTPTAIAGELKVSPSTVSRDLKWIRAQWRRTYGGTAPRLQSGEVIGEALALYQEVEVNALEDATKMRLQRTDVDLVAYAQARMACLAMGLKARQAQVALLQDLGVIERSLGHVDVTALPNAAHLRRVLASVKPADLLEAPPPAPAA
jgi:P27 family predicted phage terminase small subunit